MKLLYGSFVLVLLSPLYVAASGLSNNPQREVEQPLGEEVPLCLNAPPWQQFDGVDAGDAGRVNAYGYATPGHQGDEGLDVAFVVFCPLGPDGPLSPWGDDPDPLPNE